MSKKEIFLLCIDGGDFNLFAPFIEKGKMPNLKKIQKEGSHGYLTSTMPPITAPAWSSFLTGKNPGKHGIFSFALKKDGSYDHTILNSTSREGKAFWDILGDRGIKTVILNIPITYPPTPVNGAMISDFLTPSGKRDFTYPINLIDELEDKFGHYPLYFNTPIAITNDKNIDTFLKECHYALDYKFKSAFYLKEKFKSDITILHIWETDQIFHWLLHIFYEKHPAFNKKKNERFIDKVNDYFFKLDKYIGDILHGMGDNGSIIIVSDHG
ncbi:MAG: alkaline phosphatase family protein, partial [Thermodesulfobacteriota bacterium]|nr:alkaline phosphatase family protein [Thermodesulfobacteriota bacterium]